MSCNCRKISLLRWVNTWRNNRNPIDIIHLRSYIIRRGPPLPFIAAHLVGGSIRLVCRARMVLFRETSTNAPVKPTTAAPHRPRPILNPRISVRLCPWILCRRSSITSISSFCSSISWFCLLLMRRSTPLQIAKKTMNYKYALCLGYCFYSRKKNYWKIFGKINAFNTPKINV